MGKTLDHSPQFCIPVDGWNNDAELVRGVSHERSGLPRSTTGLREWTGTLPEIEAVAK